MTSAASETILNPAMAVPPIARGGAVERQQRHGVELMRLGADDSYLIDMTVHPLPGEDLRAMLYRMNEIVRGMKVIPVQQFIFGSPDSLRNGNEVAREILGESAWPINWVAGAGVQQTLAGMQIIAVSERKITPIKVDGRVLAVTFDQGMARHCMIGGLGYTHPSEPRPLQTEKALIQLKNLLEQAGFQFGDIARTWFYLHDILAWYDDFNRVRTAFYKPHTFRLGTLPASTGISAPNPFGSALSLGAWAVQPLKQDDVPVREVISPLQCPAACYGSAFSRAIEMDLPGGRRVLVSGTASIEPGGKTVWDGDIVRQIELTMKVVNAIIESRNMSLEDVTRCSLYFKKPEFAKAFADWFRQHGPKAMPAVAIHSDICRDDLLFEIELDCMRADR